jgi:hypothetical protein
MGPFKPHYTDRVSSTLPKAEIFEIAVLELRGITRAVRMFCPATTCFVQLSSCCSWLSESLRSSGITGHMPRQWRTHLRLRPRRPEASRGGAVEISLTVPGCRCPWIGTIPTGSRSRC